MGNITQYLHRLNKKLQGEYNTALSHLEDFFERKLKIVNDLKNALQHFPCLEVQTSHPEVLE